MRYAGKLAMSRSALSFWATLLRLVLLCGLFAGLLPWTLAACAAASSPGVDQGSQPQTIASAVTTPEADLLARRAFVLVVIDGADRRLKGSEAYGDWQAYLQSFVARRRGELPVHQVSPEQARKLLPSWPSGLRNATLFVSVPSPQPRGLLHRGLVLEPQVYLIGKSFAEGGEESKQAASFGLEPFDLKR
jgi:hypothetical protein